MMNRETWLRLLKWVRVWYSMMMVAGPLAVFTWATGGLKWVLAGFIFVIPAVVIMFVHGEIQRVQARIDRAKLFQ